jgi:pyruvate dehydrogenase E1 component
MAHIFKDGLRRMFGEAPENIYYYLTVYNEPYRQPVEPEGVDVEGILNGMHLISESLGEGPHVQLLASGVSVPWALRAQTMLLEEWGVHADVWSVTSWNELRRNGLEVDRYNFLNPESEQRVAYITKRLAGRQGPVIAVSDWMRSVQDQVREWVEQPFVSLGTDGWGMSDTRGALRRHFLVDSESIVVQALTMLGKQNLIERAKIAEAIVRYQLHDPAAAYAGNTEGSG